MSVRSLLCLAALAAVALAVPCGETGRAAAPPPEPRYVVRGLDGAICDLAFSPDSRLLACANYMGGPVRIYEISTHRTIAWLDATRDGHSQACVAFSPDGKLLASAGSLGRVYLWETKGWTLAQALPILKCSITSVAFSPDGKTLAYGSDAKTLGTGIDGGRVWLWDLQRRKPLGSVFKHENRVRSIVFTPDSKSLLAACNDDDDIGMYDLPTLKLKRTFSAGKGLLRGFHLSSDGRVLASTRWFQSEPSYTWVPGWVMRQYVASDIRLWDVATGKELRTLSPRPLPFASSPTFHPEGNVLAVLSDNKVRLWNSVTGRELHRLGGHDKNVWSVAFSPDGRWLASGSMGTDDIGTLVLYDLAWMRRAKKPKPEPPKK